MAEILSQEDARYVFDLCIEAGAKAVQMREGVDISTKSHADDLVTGADKALSEMLVSRLQERFPEDTVLSEEAPWQSEDNGKRRWIIDPIDGTKYYVDGSGKYCVMVGLVVNGKEAFGAVYMPQQEVGFYGGPSMGCYAYKDKAVTKLSSAQGQEVIVWPAGDASGPSKKLRMLVSKNDLKANDWLEKLETVEIVTASSIGFDVYELHLGLADIFVHIRPTLGYWDTAASGAVAQGMGYEVGTEADDSLTYGFVSPKHLPHVVIGKPGSLTVWREIFKQHQAQSQAQTPAQAPAQTPASAPADQ